MFVLLLNGISTFLFNAKTILLEQKWYYLTHRWEVKRVHTFLMGIYRKANVITRWVFELAYYDAAVQRFNHYATMTPPFMLLYHF